MEPVFFSRFNGEPFVYVRKLGKKSDWTLDAPSLELLFGSDADTSLYKITSELELMQVAVGLNSRRHSLTELIDLLPILPRDLEDCGIVPKPTLGNLGCDCANALHVDITRTNDLDKLLNRLINEKRQSVRFTRGDMNTIVKTLAGCKVVTGSCAYHVSDTSRAPSNML